jgi:ABC-type Na+ efflux pump permease subunit
MRKIFTIAAREYRAMVGTKAFLISIIMMPILMLGSVFAMSFFNKVGEVKHRKIAVIDHSGKIFDTLKSITDQRNRRALSEPDSNNYNAKRSLSGASREDYLLELISEPNIDEQFLLEMSDQIRDQQLYAFIEIPPTILDPIDAQMPSAPAAVKFYSQDSSLSEARAYLAGALNTIVKRTRLRDANIDVAAVELASQNVPVKGLGLLTRAANGTVENAKETHELVAIFLPMGVMMLMFMVIFMASQPMLESVIEEKSQRIAEVLLGSANPLQLMLGNLLGTVAGALTIFAIYLFGGYFIAENQGYTALVPFHLTPWFIAFQIVGVLFYAAIFMAVGASVSQLKEAQAMLLPVWMLLMSPMFIWIMLVREPLGMLATGFSLFPPATPTTMMLRMATGQAIPLWQPVLGLILTILATLLIVVIAARIFRVGILWQGKTPKLGELIKWAVFGA